MIQGVKIAPIAILHFHHAVAEFLIRTKSLHSHVGEWDATCMVKYLVTVFIADVQVITHVISEHLIVACVHLIIELCKRGSLLLLSVYIDDFVLNLEGLAWQTHTTLHIIFPSVSRTGGHTAVHIGFGGHNLLSDAIKLVPHLLLLLSLQRFHQRYLIALFRGRHTSLFIAEAVVVTIVRNGHRISCWVVEHHNVSPFHFAEALHAAIFPLRPFDVRLAVQHRDSVLRQGHSEGCLRNAWPITHLAHQQEVARHQRLLQRR